MPEKTNERRGAGGRAGITMVGSTVSPLPEPRLGFVFAAVIFLADLAGSAVADFGLTLLRVSALTFGVAYWLFCVHRLHVILRELDPSYPISPEAAVGWHLPPFVSLYWIFKWPMEFSNFVNARGFTKMVPGGWLGLALFGCLVAGQAYWGVGLAATFLITWHLAAKLRYGLRFRDLRASEVVEPRPAETAGAILAGNVANYIIASPGLILLLLMPRESSRPVLILAVFALTFTVSGFAAGVISGNIGRRSGPALGVPANLAVVGSLLVGLYIVRGHDLSVFYFTALPVLTGLSFGLSVIGTSVGEQWQEEGKYPFLWTAERLEPGDGAAGYPEAAASPEPPAAAPDPVPAVDSPPPPADPTSTYRRLLGGIVVGNLTGGVILLFYRYPAAFVAHIWGDEVYVFMRLADMLVIVTGAFIAAYAAMLIAKEQRWAVGVGANGIMYLTMLILLTRGFLAGDFWAEFAAVSPLAPVVLVAGLLGAKAAENSDKDLGKWETTLPR